MLDGIRRTKKENMKDTQIKPHEDELTFTIISPDSGQEYIVCVSPQRDNYGCSCGIHRYKLAKNVDNGAELFTPKTECKHQTAVIRYLGLQVATYEA